MLLVPVPRSARPWAWPFLTVWAPSQRANEAAGKRPKTSIDGTVQRVKGVARGLGSRRWVLIGEGGLACVHLALTGRDLIAPLVTLIAWLRRDAQHYDFPAPRPPGRRGRQPKKGRKKRKLKDRIKDAQRRGKQTTVAWYGGRRKPVYWLSGQCLWHTSGFAPVPIRGVLGVDPTSKHWPEAFFSTDRHWAPERIVEYDVLCWNLEVIFEEARRHLGVETQRQGSDWAIARTTPGWLALYSLICLMGYRRMNIGQIVPRSAAGYPKEHATFSDVLAFVRRAIGAEEYFSQSTFRGDPVMIHRDDWEAVVTQLASTA